MTCNSGQVATGPEQIALDGVVALRRGSVGMVFSAMAIVLTGVMDLGNVR